MKLSLKLTQALVVTLISSAALAGEGVVVGGYVDAQWGIDDSNEGSRVQGGQLSFSKTTGDSSFVVEIPFSAISASDVDPGSSDLRLGKNTAQAYVRNNHSNGIYWMLGQWDGIFGMERNDTNMVQFTTQGALFATQPKVNNGLLVGYKLGETMNLEAYVSGSKDEGGNNSNFKPEVGLKYSMTGDLKFSLGFNTQSEAVDVRRMYVNSVIGTKLSVIDLGAEITYAKAGEGDAETGFGLLGSYEISEGFTFGARVQKMSNFGGAFSTTHLTVGPQYALSKELRLKADFSQASVIATDGAAAEITSSGALAAVYSF